MTTTTAYRKLTLAELHAEATERFGPDVMRWAFRCPSCGDIATPQDFKEAGGSAGMAGQECIGRHLGALRKPAGPGGKNAAGRGCDWTAYGLIRGPWEVIVPSEDGKPERSVWGFELGPAPEPADRPALTDMVWIAAARRDIEAHRPTDGRTACGRSTRTGEHLDAAMATARHGARWCPRCWPPATP